MEYEKNFEKKFVEMLIDRFQIELKKQDRSGVYGLTQRMVAYNSNKIEGSTLTEQHTASLFETGSIKANGEIIRAKDVEEMTGHFAMFNHMIKTIDEPLSENLIKQFHFYLKSGVFEDLANGYSVGEYKNRGNKVGEYDTTPPDKVNEEIKKLLDEYDVSRLHTLKEIADFHAKYEIIHPFQDGNGRTGRIIAFRECLKNEIIPVVIQDKNKIEYVYALRDYREEINQNALYDYFKKERDAYFEKAKELVVPYSNKSIELRVAEAKTSKALKNNEKEIKSILEHTKKELNKSKIDKEK